MGGDDTAFSFGDPRDRVAELGGGCSNLFAIGRSAVLVTHELRQVSELADAVVVIAAGRAVHRAEGEALALERLERAYLSAVEGAD